MKIKRNLFQSLYHFVIEDMLWMEHDMDFEDFKETVMFHGILQEDDYKLLNLIDAADHEIHAFMADRLSESDCSSRLHID